MVSENRGRSAAMAIAADILPFILYRDLGRRRLSRFRMKNARLPSTLRFVYLLLDNKTFLQRKAEKYNPEISHANCSLACAGQEEWRGGPQRNQCGAEQRRLLGYFVGNNPDCIAMHPDRYIPNIPPGPDAGVLTHWFRKPRHTTKSNAGIFVLENSLDSTSKPGLTFFWLHIRGT